MYHLLINLTKLGELVQLSLCCKPPTKITKWLQKYWSMFPTRLPIEIVYWYIFIWLKNVTLEEILGVKIVSSPYFDADWKPN